MVLLIRIFIFFYIFTLLNLLSSCNDADNNIEEGNDSKKKDSLKSLHNAVYLYDEAENAAVDSLKKFNLTEIADSCLKFLYVTNYNIKFTDDLWCKNNSLTIGESRIKPIGFVSRGIDEKHILFKVFLQDSIPCRLDLESNGHVIPIGFSVSVRSKKIEEVLMGEYTRRSFNYYKMTYDSIVSSNEFKSYLQLKNTTIHPTFKRLLFYQDSVK